ncbi:MAG: Protein translocase subunit SecE [Chlamydiia bacterium]|nr:Protein translocase subunit SecE [Chlamydiia bacterium]
MAQRIGILRKTNEEKQEKVSSSYISELKSEVKKITWPKKNELIRSTKVVLLVTLFAGFGIYFADLMIRGVLSGLHHLTQIFIR